MNLRTWGSSVWQKTPLWIKGIAFALCLYAILAGIGFVIVTASFRLPIGWFDPSRPGLVFGIKLLGFLAFAVELGPGMLVLAQAGGLTPGVFVLPATVYSLVGAVCFRLLGVRRGTILTAALILVIDMGSFLIFMLLNIG